MDFGPRVSIRFVPKLNAIPGIRSGCRIYVQDYPVGFGQLVPKNTGAGQWPRFCAADSELVLSL